MSPAITEAGEAVFTTEISAELPPELPVTPKVIVSLGAFRSAIFASGELTCSPLTIEPVPVAVVVSVTEGVVDPAASGDPTV